MILDGLVLCGDISNCIAFSWVSYYSSSSLSNSTESSILKTYVSTLTLLVHFLAQCLHSTTHLVGMHYMPKVLPYFVFPIFDLIQMILIVVSIYKLGALQEFLGRGSSDDNSRENQGRSGDPIIAGVDMNGSNYGSSNSNSTENYDNLGLKIYEGIYENLCRKRSRTDTSTGTTRPPRGSSKNLWGLFLFYVGVVIVLFLLHVFLHFLSSFSWFMISGSDKKYDQRDGMNKSNKVTLGRLFSLPWQYFIMAILLDGANLIVNVPQLYVFWKSKKVPLILGDFLVLLTMQKVCQLFFWILFPSLMGWTPRNSSYSIIVIIFNLAIVADFLFYYCIAWSRKEKTISHRIMEKETEFKDVVEKGYDNTNDSTIRRTNNKSGEDLEMLVTEKEMIKRCGGGNDKTTIVSYQTEEVDRLHPDYHNESNPFYSNPFDSNDKEKPSTKSVTGFFSRFFSKGNTMEDQYNRGVLDMHDIL